VPPTRNAKLTCAQRSYGGNGPSSGARSNLASAATPTSLALPFGVQPRLWATRCAINIPFERPVRKVSLSNASFAANAGGLTTVALSSAGAYVADNLRGYRAVAGATMSRINEDDGTVSIRLQRDQGNAATNSIAALMEISGATLTQLLGRIITVAVEAKRGADFSAASGINIRFYYSTDANPVFGSLPYPNGAIELSSPGTNKDMTTSFQLFAYSPNVVIPVNATRLYVQFQATAFSSSAAGADDSFTVRLPRIDIGAHYQPF
jgi:hypothetical protein